jgi:hypothetical protein
MIVNRTMKMKVMPIDKRKNNRDIYSLGTMGFSEVLRSTIRFNNRHGEPLMKLLFEEEL